MRKLSQTEEEILNILWDLGKGYPKEILSQFKREMPYNTFLSTIRKLEKEGFIDFEKFGRSHRYFPLITKKDYSRSIFKNLLSNFFEGSKEKMLSFFVEEEKISAEELQEYIDKFKTKNDD